MNYLSHQEHRLRCQKVQAAMKDQGAELALFTANPNLFYLTGAVFDGYIALPAQGECHVFVRRPAGFALPFGGPAAIRKPEQIPELLGQRGVLPPASVCLEEEDISAAEWMRLKNLYPKAESVHASLGRLARMVKTEQEIEQIHSSAEHQAALYAKIPSLFGEGMTDQELSARIEYLARSNGHLGIFRTFGFRMEAHMGTILCGDNGAAPSCYDFALGGAGQHPSLPVGINGGVIRAGTSIMVDITGNHNGYQSDCTRTFSAGRLPEKAYEAHHLSIAIQEECARLGTPGTPCCELYGRALELVEKAGLTEFFMGTAQQAKFIGHGLGIEINELPVISPRSQTPLQEGMVIALEPKFVLPGIGAVGTENTFAVTRQGLRRLTPAEQDLKDLSQK